MLPLSPTATDEWIAGALLGDEAASAALFHAHYPAVLRLCLGLLNDLGDAEEVAQDAFVYALRNLSRFDPRRAAFRTWLFTIALSRCRNKRRRKTLVQLPLEMLSGELRTVPRVVEAALEQQGLRRQLWQALQALSEPVREAVVLRYLGGLRYKEIAEAVQCNPKTAESRTWLGVAALRAALTPEAAEAEPWLTEGALA